MPRKILMLALALGLLLTPGQLWGQGATLTGYIRSDAQAPIPGAVVGIESLDLRVVTNDYGQFLIIVPAQYVNGQQVVLAATSIGYEEASATVTLNPPYGRRLKTEGHAEQFYARIGSHLANHLSGWQLILVLPQPTLLKQLPFEVKTQPFTHGGLDLVLATGRIPKQP